MKKKLLLLVSSLLIVILLAACGASDNNEGTSNESKDANSGESESSNDLIISIPAEAETLDPGVTMDNASWKITYQSYERLVEYDGEKTDVIPGLAKEWEISDDGLTYTFNLEEGHLFDDGSEVDAEAVKFTFDRTLEIAKGPSSLYEIIKNIEVIDDMTVEFTLDNEFPPFISTLAANYGSIVNPNVMEHEEDGDFGQKYLSTHTMGSGPYVLDEYVEGQYYKLLVNENYDENPELEIVYFQIASDTSGARLRLENGEIDIMEGLPVDQIAQIESKEGIQVLQEPSLLVDYIYMNIGKGADALKNNEVREAISYAISYDSIIDSIMEGYGTQFRGPVPEGLWGHNPDLFMYEQDIDKAEEIMNASGEEDVTLELLYSDNKPYWEELSLVIQDDLSKIGIDVNLTKVAYSTMREQLDIGEFDLSLGVWSPDYADPYMFMNYWFDSDNQGLAGNRSFYENSSVDDLIREAASISDQDEREKLYFEAQDIIVEDNVYIYLAQKDFVLPMRENVQGFKYNPMLEGIYNLTEMSK